MIWHSNLNLYYQGHILEHLILQKMTRIQKQAFHFSDIDIYTSSSFSEICLLKQFFHLIKTFLSVDLRTFFLLIILLLSSFLSLYSTETMVFPFLFFLPFFLSLSLFPFLPSSLPPFLSFFHSPSLPLPFSFPSLLFILPPSVPSSLSLSFPSFLRSCTISSLQIQLYILKFFS